MFTDNSKTYAKHAFLRNKVSTNDMIRAPLVDNHSHRHVKKGPMVTCRSADKHGQLTYASKLVPRLSLCHCSGGGLLTNQTFDINEVLYKTKGHNTTTLINSQAAVMFQAKDTHRNKSEQGGGGC